MIKHKSQQFAKFFIKDVKVKLPKYKSKESALDESNLS